MIEAVFEHIPVKEEVFKKLDAVMKPGALLYTNTSGIDIDIMANATKRPQDVAGTHFFAPANVMKLFEVVKGAKSAPDTLATAMALGRKIGKVSALAGNGDGFVANRSRTPFGTEMNIMLEEGALPEQVDKVMVDFGYPIGPFATADLSGLDIGYDSRKRRAAQNPNYRKMPIADRIVEAGRLGQKNGTGWFRYEPGDRTPHPDPEVARIIKEKAAEMGVAAARVQRRGDPAPAALRHRQRGVQHPRRGQGLRASDIDVMWLHGFGFPRYRGGLMYWADGIGVARGLQPDRRLAPALRRALGPLAAPAPASPKPAPRSARQSPAGRCKASAEGRDPLLTTMAVARAGFSSAPPSRPLAVWIGLSGGPVSTGGADGYPIQRQSSRQSPQPPVRRFAGGDAAISDPWLSAGAVVQGASCHSDVLGGAAGRSLADGDGERRERPSSLGRGAPRSAQRPVLDLCRAGPAAGGAVGS